MGPQYQELRSLLNRQGIRLGTCAAYRYLATVRDYGAVLAQSFDSITPEVELKWESLRRKPDTFDFRRADRLLQFAREHGLHVRGHNLCWHLFMPRWVRWAGWAPAEQAAQLIHHIQTVVGHCESEYPGLVQEWDVVNEIFDHEGKPHPTVFRELGDTPLDYVRQALRTTATAAPAARLYLNEDNAESVNAKSDALYRFVLELLQEKVPLHGLGLQMHLRLDALPDFASVRENLARFAALGLELQVTELDVAIPRSMARDREKALHEQARVYREVLNLVLEQEAIRGLTLWGFSDRFSWIPNRWFREYESPCLFDRRARAKPAFQTVVDSLQGITPPAH